jgi:hypothetical protein
MIGSMLDFMHEGGLLMWPLFIGGVVTIVAAAKRALGGGEGLFDPARMSRTLLLAALAWSAVGLRYACSARFTDEPPFTVYLAGMGEALAPAILGLAVAAAVGLLGAWSRGATGTVRGTGTA